jgi:L-aminopeptidase/D-esterase-like protein
MSRVPLVHAVLLSGGSAFGLDAAAGVMRYLEERGVGFRVGPAVVPIVPAAILFDLGVATHKVRPGPPEAYQACLAATAGPVPQGSVGAGTGATVGKALGLERATKGGLGTASVFLGDGLAVAALVAVNAYGDVVDPESGRVLAGPRRQDGPGFWSTLDLLVQGRARTMPGLPTNTTIGVVATNARLTKEQACKLAVHAHDGLALAVRPCHTMGDGDLFFALATGAASQPADVDRLGAAAVLAVSQAIVTAVREATGLAGIPSAQEVVRGAA